MMGCQGDQFCQHDRIWGWPGRDEILDKLGGYVRGTVGDRGLFVREVIEERARRNSGFDTDVLDGHLVPAAVLRQAHRGVADVRAGLPVTALAQTDVIR